MTGLLLLPLGGLAAFPHVGYATLMRRVPPRPAGARRPWTTPPTVSVCIPAYNEGAHLSAKIENTLGLDWPADRLEVLVCDDGSRDDGPAQVEAFADRGVRLLRNPENRGKPTTLGHLAREATGEILLFTDASAMLKADCLRLLIDALGDLDVGLAAARYVVRPPEEAQKPAEASYWDHEAAIRRDEAARDMLLGVSGAAYAVRRALWRDLPADTINDDWVVPARVLAAGHRIAYVHEAVASDRPTGRGRGLFDRWVRIAFGNYQMLWRHRDLWTRGPRFALPMARKLLKTAGPLLLIGAGGVVVLGAGAGDPLAVGLLALGAAAVGVGALAVLAPEEGWGARRPLAQVRFGVLAQAAYLRGAWRFARGQGEGIWRRTEGVA